jgi:exopolysaccharide biosynthesis operon protein EpsL
MEFSLYIHTALNIQRFIDNIQPKRLATGLLYLLILLTFLLSLAAYADDKDPLNFNVGISRKHDNNLFLSPSSTRSDNITTSNAGIHLDKLYSLQRFKVNYTITAYRYQNNNRLNFNAHNYNAAWLWSLTPYLTGIVSADRQQQLNDFQDYRNFTLVNVKNVRVTQNQHFEADFSPHGIWHLLGGVTRSEQTNSRTFNEQDSFSMYSLDEGVKYDFRSGSSIKLMAHERQGDYSRRIPNSASLFDTGFIEKEIETKLDWLISGKSRINLRAAYLNRDHDHFSQRDYSGAVGRLDYSWAPTGKLLLTFSALSDLSSYWNLDSSYARYNSISISPAYALSDKLTMRASASVYERKFLGGGVIPSTDRVDRGKSASVGIDWTPLRSLTIGGNLVRSSRNSNITGLDYDDTTAEIDANLLF